MDDISDQNSVREAKILVDTMMKRYAHHPALLAVGYDNEIGNGFVSYSAGDRERFISWLEKGTLQYRHSTMLGQRSAGRVA